MGTVVLAAQLFLAAVFATAAIGKFMDLLGSRMALAEFGFPKRWVPQAGLALPIAEAIAAVALIFSPTARWGALLAFALLLAFIVGISVALSRGKQPQCHCFGQIHSAPAGPFTLARNGVLAGVALLIVIHGAGTPLDDWIADRSGTELAAVGLGLAALLLAGLSAYLWRDREAIKKRHAAAQAEVDSLPPGLPVGLKAPNFALPDVHGEMHSLASLTEDDTPVMLIFTGPYCGACKAMMPDVARWQPALTGRLNIAVMSGGTLEQNLPLAQEHGLENVIIQEDYEVMWEYRVRATPTAIVVAPDLTVATLPATGQVAIEPLVRLALERETITPGRSSSNAAPVDD